MLKVTSVIITISEALPVAILTRLITAASNAGIRLANARLRQKSGQVDDQASVLMNPANALPNFPMA
jgi:hypothetical protein